MLKLVCRVLSLAVGFSFLAHVTFPEPVSAGGGVITARSHVGFTGCEKVRYRYSIDLPSTATYWSMDVSYVGRDGLEEGSDFVYNAPTSGEVQDTLCGDPGRYTIEAIVTWHDDDYNEQEFALRGSTFRVSRPGSQLTMKVSKTRLRKNEVFTFKVALRDQRPNGYFPSEYEPVVLQLRVGSRWKTLGRFKEYTDTRGRATFKARYNGRPAKVRAKSLTDRAKRAKSRPVTLRRR